MKTIKHFFVQFATLTIMSLLTLWVNATPILSNLTVTSPTTGLLYKYEKYELTFDLSGSSAGPFNGFVNPFNPHEIDVYAIFISPTNKQYQVNAFYYEGYQDNPNPTRIRIDAKNFFVFMFLFFLSELQSINKIIVKQCQIINFT